MAGEAGHSYKRGDGRLHQSILRVTVQQGTQDIRGKNERMHTKLAWIYLKLEGGE